MFIETSSPAATGNAARLLSSPIQAGTSCFQFAYHMYGQSTGKLYCLVFHFNSIALNNELHVSKVSVFRYA